MRLPVAVALGMLVLAGCNKSRENRESGQVGGGMDTTATTRHMKDTALIRHDTTVKVDTTKKR